MKNKTINVKYVINEIDNKKYRFKIYLFDCCRSKIKEEKKRAMDANHSLTPIAAKLQTLIVFACASDESVLDETLNERNGSSIENLLKHITTCDKNIEEIGYYVVVILIDKQEAFNYHIEQVLL
jgi:hypothetical protein